MLHIIQNDPRVPAGIFGKILRERRVDCRTVRPYAGEGFPAPDEGAIQVESEEAGGAVVATTAGDESPGWLALTLLGTGTIAMLALAVATRWRKRSLVRV